MATKEIALFSKLLFGFGYSHLRYWFQKRALVFNRDLMAFNRLLVCHIAFWHYRDLSFLKNLDMLALPG